jgi:hypothetical protein
MTSSTKPVELIVSNVTYEILEKMGEVERLLQATGNKRQIKPCDVADGYARGLLCQIAHLGAMHVVLKALEALGAPSSESEIWARLEAAKEQQRRESCGG